MPLDLNNGFLRVLAEQSSNAQITRNKWRETMLFRYAICLFAVLASGCTTYSSIPLSRNQCDGLSKDTCAPVKGVPIAVKVPTHLDVYIDETFFLLPDAGDIYQEVQILDINGSPIRNLGIRPQMIQTKKIFVVDFKRAAAGITSNGLETTIMMASGECLTTFSVTLFTIPALVSIKSSRLIPGFLGNPDVIITTSEPAVLL